MRRLALTLAAVTATAALLAGCGDDDDDTSTETTTATTTTTTATEPAAPPAPPSTAPGELPANCQEAPPEVAILINGLMKDSTQRVDRVFVARIGDLTYYGANIMAADGKRISSADTWVSRGDDLATMAALSGSANQYTSMPDGRDLYRVSAGDPVPTQLQQCSTATARQGQGGR